MQSRITRKESNSEDVSEMSSSPPRYEEIAGNSGMSRRSTRQMSSSGDVYSHRELREISPDPKHRASMNSNLRSSSHRQLNPAILVMGATGAGKSSFIASATKMPVSIGHTLESHTMEPQGWQTSRADGTTITLIDTPGFNDTKRPDTELLASIITFIYQHNFHIISVVYIHQITERRLSGSTVKNLRVLRGLCGEHYFQNIILATSMWTKAPADEMDDQVDREVQINSSPQFWGDMLQKGATYYRWDDTKSIPAAKSAQEIIMVSGKWNDVPKLAVFLEMEKGIKLGDTEAYRVLTEQLRKKQEREQRERRHEQEEMDRLRAQKTELEAIARKEKDDCIRELGELRRLESEVQGGMGSSSRAATTHGLRDVFQSFSRPAMFRRRSESAASSMPLVGAQSQSQSEVDDHRRFSAIRNPSRDEHPIEGNFMRSSRSSGERRYESGPESSSRWRSGRRSHRSNYEIVLVRRKRR